jgi:uncharacterized damage-inducible protein DinB
MDLSALFAYDDWANRESLAALRAAAPAPPGAVRVMGHIVGAEKLWLARLEARTPPSPVWPELDLAACQAALDGLRPGWQALLARLDERELERSIEYVNTRGEPWTSRVRDVLAQVVLHSAHHRGQIAAALRAAGREPPLTDLIHAVRTGRVGGV